MPLGGTSLGAAPLGSTTGLAPLPSAAAGVGGANPFEQLATAAVQIPAAEMAVKKKKQEADLLKTQIEQEKMKAAQTKAPFIANMLKADPYNQTYLDAFRANQQALGLPAPIVGGAGSPGPSPSAGSQAGGSGTPGAPAQVGPIEQLGLPPQNAQQPPMATPQPQGGTQGGDQRQHADLDVLFPHADIRDILDKNPEFAKVLNSSKPAQRIPILAAYGVTPGNPLYDAFVNAPVTKTSAELNIDIGSYRTMWTQFNQGKATLASAQAFISSMGPRLAEDGVDISQVITPDQKMQIGADAQAHIHLLEDQGIMDKAKGEAALKKAQYDIDNLGQLAKLRSSQISRNNAQANLDSTRAALLPEQVQSQIQSRLASSQHAAERINMTRQKYHDAATKASPMALSKERSALAGEATNLRGQIATLTGMTKTLYNTTPNAPDPDGSGETYVHAIALKLKPLNDQLRDVTADMRDADNTARAVQERAVAAAVKAGGGTIRQPAAAAQDSSAPPDRQYNGRRIGVSGGKWVYRDTGQPVQ